jgi:hypothetical protein
MVGSARRKRENRNDFSTLAGPFPLPVISPRATVATTLASGLLALDGLASDSEHGVEYFACLSTSNRITACSYTGFHASALIPVAFLP